MTDNGLGLITELAGLNSPLSEVETDQWQPGLSEPSGVCSPNGVLPLAGASVSPSSPSADGF